MPNVLEAFENDIKRGLETSNFLRRYDEVHSYILRNPKMLENFRLGKGPVKKFSDELTPCKRFIKTYQDQYIQIRSPLNSSYPDCFVMDKKGSEKEVEITITQGAERAILMQELNANGMSRGFLGLTDEQSYLAHQEAMKQSASAFSTEEAIQCAVESIELCVRKKNESKADEIDRKRDVLLIEHHLLPLSLANWKFNMSQLKAAAWSSKFREVYLVGWTPEDENICWCLASPNR